MNKILFIFCLFFVSVVVNAQTVVRAEKGHWTATYYGNHYKKQRKTASGEIFNVNAMTCAAPKVFKFGTRLKITNLSNNKSVIVRVNDRGGFGNRTLDLTYHAFKKIASHRDGRVKVKVQVLK